MKFAKIVRFIYITLAVLLSALVLTSCGNGSPVPSESTAFSSADVSSTQLSSQVSLPSSQDVLSDVTSSRPESDKQDDEVKGMWITYFELGSMYKSKKGFATEFDSALKRCEEFGINNIYVHVRSHCDAYYKSDIFPWSAYLTGKQGDNPQTDPLQIMIDKAHAKGIKLHAWINPYRVAIDSTDLELLDDKNPAKQWLTDADPDNDCRVVECKGGLYLNPAEISVQQLIADGVREILEKYNVDGIHFDDYFYPTTDESFDEAQYAAYRTEVSSNPLPLADWRRANVNAMVSTVYKAIKNIRPDCIFGISPMASINNNYHTVFADIKAWLDGGYVDYIMPQLYFGFEYPKENSRFDYLLEEWLKLFENYQAKLYIGLGAYRIGATDKDNEEWSKYDDILSRQAALLKQEVRVSGWVLYSYSTFFADTERAKAERDNFLKTINAADGE